MTIYKRAICALCCVLLSNFVWAQKNLIHVNQVSGTANVSVPLYALNAAHVSLPIGIVYNGHGIKPTDVEGSAGMGWSFSAGGQVSRELHGLPDDVKKDMAGNDRVGWLYNTNGTKIASLSIANDNRPDTYTDVATDVSNINTAFGDLSDTEPDVFDVSAPGLNCQLVYDNVNATFRTIPYQDVKVALTTSTISGPTYGEITAFTITNDQGIVYTFAATETTTQKVLTAASPQYFKTAYNQYLNGITYASTWNLTQIQDPYNNVINLTYAAGYKKGFTTPVTLTFAITPWFDSGSSVHLTADSVQYTLYGGTTPNLLSNISYSDGVSTSAFSLTWLYNSTTYKYVISTIQGFGHNFNFNYSNEVGSGNSLSRNFLRSVSDGDCSSPFNYSFAYNGETYNSTTSTYTSALPDSVQSASLSDRWGYVSSNPAAGTLNQINYVDGGNTAITYEPNIYNNGPSGNGVGSGIRVLRIIDYDGITTANNITTTYDYTTPVTEAPSGKAISFPVLSFIRPYNGSGTPSSFGGYSGWIGNGSAADILRYSTVSSPGDLSEDDHSVLYQYVTKSRTGAGSTLYQFTVPAVSGDTNITTPIAWSPTQIYAGAAATVSTGSLGNGTNTYPFLPNPNYDFERGMLSKMTNYDSSGNEVSESVYTYTTSATPVTITGFKYDVNSYGVGYGKYTVNTIAGPLTSQVDNKTYDLGSTTAYQATSTSYAYNSTQHKLIQQSFVNSDGSTRVQHTVYVKDYDTSPSTLDAPSQGIKALQLLNMNIPIETYTQVIASGSSTPKTISGQLVKFSNSWPIYAGSMVLPVEKMQLVSPDGVTGFVPSSTSTGTFTKDANYLTVENDLGYDFSGNLLSKSDNYKHVQTMITDHNTCRPVAVFTNARFDEIATSNFDSRLVNLDFTLSGGSATTNSRSGTYGWLFYTGQTISKTISRNTSAKNYVFSIWVNASAAGQFNVSVTGGGVTNTGIATYGITSGTATGWHYCVVKVPLTGISSSTIAISASSTQNVIIDDVLTYPDVAEASTIAYDPALRTKTAETNNNGVSAYYAYDMLGRLHYTYDQDKNMVQRNQYALGNNIANFNTGFSIAGPATAYHGIPVTFNNTSSFNPCSSVGLSFTWNFGDGTASVVSTAILAPQAHTYATNGTYTVTVTANSPAYGAITRTLSITVSTLSAVNVTYNNYTLPGSAPDHTYCHIYSVTFKQGATTMYTLSESDLTSGTATIAPGAYTVVVQAFGPTYNSTTGYGYSAVVWNGQCLPFSTTGNTYTFTDDLTLTPVANVSIQNAVCSGGGGGSGYGN